MEIFRTFEYNGQILQLAAYKPETPASPLAGLPSGSAPGAGKIEIGPLSLSAEKIAPGEPLTLTAQVKGHQIAFIYSEILLLDKDLNQAYGPVARAHIRAERDKETGGISHPDWDETLNLMLTLTPGLRLLTDGVNSAFGFLIPDGYDNSDYRLDGLYTSADGTIQRRARIKFNKDGETKNLVLFKEAGIGSAPHALTPNPNDKFSPFVQTFHLPTEENPIWHVETALSTQLTFSGHKLRWAIQPPLPGDYLVGLLVQDLDGGFIRKYAPLTISA